jgi:hypothetical protein
LSIGDLPPLLILATQETQCVGKSGWIIPVKKYKRFGIYRYRADKAVLTCESGSGLAISAVKPTAIGVNEFGSGDRVSVNIV